MKIYNKPKTQLYRRILRSNMTIQEIKLWRFLRRRQLLGIKFCRQYGVFNFILDFYSPELRLGIEIDGGHHSLDEVRRYDLKRTELIEQYDITILRFTNNEVDKRIDDVLKSIAYEIEKRVGNTPCHY